MKNYLRIEKSLYGHFYKIRKFAYFIILMNSLAFAQNRESAPEIFYTPNGIFDQVFDTGSRISRLSEIEIPKTHSTKNGKTVLNTQSFTSGIFELYFENGSGMEILGNPLHDQRRAVILQAFQDLSDFINTPLKNTGNKVKFWIRSPSAAGLASGKASSASAYYSFPTFSAGMSNQNIDFGGILDNEIWKTIHTGFDSYSNIILPLINTNSTGNFYHGWASFNFSGTVSWNLDYNKYNAATSYPSNALDFYSTIIHEVTHALGFVSFMKDNNTSTFYNNPGNYFTRYDKNLKTGSDLPLIINVPATAGQMYRFIYNPAITGTVLFPGCTSFPPVFNGNSGSYNCSTSMKYAGSVTVPVYTPACFEYGGSLSHFEDACYNGNSNDQYFMMSDRASNAFAKRTLTNEERQVLCDIGYSLQGTFGSPGNFTYKNYGAASCAGIPVGGVNDGFSGGAYTFQGNAGTDIMVNGILSNDYTAGSPSDLRFEFVQDLYDPDAMISVLSNTSFVIKSYVPGVHLLRYVPFDQVTGKRGNITYIYVNVFNTCTNIALPNLVRNGDFEEHTYAPTGTSQIYKSCGWQSPAYFPSPDYFNTDATNMQVLIPSNLFGYQTDKIPGHHAYGGMLIDANRPNVLENIYSESLKTELITALLPNTQYQLSFDVSKAYNYQFNAIKFQAFISDADLNLTTAGIIPASYITPDQVFLTNSAFTGNSSITTWETITFTFTTGNNPNLKYLYLGGLNNVQVQNLNGPGVYYFIDNVSLIPFSPELGLSETEAEDNEVDIFPNPAHSVVNIRNRKCDIKSVEIYDMAGRILRSVKVDKKDIQINIADFQTGTYQIKVITDKGDVVKKMIKN